MLSRNRTPVAIYLLMFSIIIAFYLSAITGPGNTDDATSTNILFTPFNSRDVWGAKVETTDGTHQFFAGIQRVSTALGEGVNIGFAPGEELVHDEKISSNQLYYKIELAKLDILLKIFSYRYPNSVKENNDSNIDGELKHLNYIVENSSYIKCSKDDVVLLNQKNASDFAAPNMEVPFPKSVLGVLIQIVLR